MSIDTTSLAEPTVTGTRRDDLVDLFERYADHTDENGHVLIDVDTVADLILDDEDLAALIQPVRSATLRKEQ